MWRLNRMDPKDPASGWNDLSQPGQGETARGFFHPYGSAYRCNSPHRRYRKPYSKAPLIGEVESSECDRPRLARAEHLPTWQF